MLLASSKVFQKGSLFFAPKTEWPLSGNVLVCASGPSLELQIETIKELSKNHLVVCAASSSGVLLKHGIRVDYIALVEREEAVADDYSEICKYPHAFRIIMLML